MDITTMTSNGRLSLPDTVRKRLGIGKGDRIVVAEQNGKIVLEKFERGYILRCAGILQSKGNTLNGLKREKKNHNE